jgi:hypothetical protein
MNVQEQIDELMLLCNEINSDIIDEYTQANYQEFCNCSDDEILEFLSELMFLVDEVIDEELDLKYDIEEKIDEIKELLDS